MSRQRKFAFVSLFSGCGGFDLAAELTGAARVVWANDDFPAAVATYRRNFRSPVVCADIRRVEPPDVPCDIIIGGPRARTTRCSGSTKARARHVEPSIKSTFGSLPGCGPRRSFSRTSRVCFSANHGEAWALVRSGLKAPSRAMGDEPPTSITTCRSKSSTSLTWAPRSCANGWWSSARAATWASRR